MDTAYNLREATWVTTDGISTLQLLNHDVLTRIEDIRVRRVNIDKAVTLGKSAKIKTRLVLFTQTGYVQLNAVVIAANDTDIWIEGGKSIPLACIYAVDMV